MAQATLVPSPSADPAATTPTAILLPFNFTRGAGSPSFDENYRILENGEGRLTEDEEVLELES